MRRAINILGCLTLEDARRTLDKTPARHRRIRAAILGRIHTLTHGQRTDNGMVYRKP